MNIAIKKTNIFDLNHSRGINNNDKKKKEKEKKTIHNTSLNVSIHQLCR